MKAERDNLAEYWEQVAGEHGSNWVMGVNLLSYNSDRVKNTKDAAFLRFLPLYLVASFLKCQGCGKCCQLNDRIWDKGVVLSKEEATELKKYCSIKKKNGKYLLKYPCPFLKKSNKCQNYTRRPLGCRLFPMTVFSGAASENGNQGVIMNCPAGKDFYITVQLFLQDWYAYLDECKNTGKQSFAIRDLERIKQNYYHNKIDDKDMDYINKIASNRHP